jgi:hypothetical protein
MEVGVLWSRMRVVMQGICPVEGWMGSLDGYEWRVIEKGGRNKKKKEIVKE